MFLKLYLVTLSFISINCFTWFLNCSAIQKDNYWVLLLLSIENLLNLFHRSSILIIFDRDWGSNGRNLTPMAVKILHFNSKKIFCIDIRIWLFPFSYYLSFRNLKKNLDFLSFPFFLGTCVPICSFKVDTS